MSYSITPAVPQKEANPLHGNKVEGEPTFFRQRILEDFNRLSALDAKKDR